MRGDEFYYPTILSRSLPSNYAAAQKSDEPAIVV
jgi:hypothetical protein